MSNGKRKCKPQLKDVNGIRIKVGDKFKCIYEVSWCGGGNTLGKIYKVLRVSRSAEMVYMSDNHGEHDPMDYDIDIFNKQWIRINEQ